MNIDNVYYVKIYVKTITKKNENGLYDFVGEFVKNTLVYEKFDDIGPVYVDLNTGKVYDKFLLCNTCLGELYINIKAGTKPYKNLIDTNRKHMSKRKILKKYNENIKNKEGVK